MDAMQQEHYARADLDPRFALGTQDVRVAWRVHPALPWLVARQGTPTQLVIDAPSTPVPNTRPWFCGVLSLGGTLVPVFDLALWLGHPATPMRRSRVLVLDPVEAPAALLCAEEPHVLQVKPRAAAGEIDARLQPFVTASYISGENEALEFDHAKWFTTVGAQLSLAGS
jgi:chemotaxis signal transduction protein